MSKKLKLEPGYLRAAVSQNSFNDTDNTVEIVFATETGVQRRSWDGKYIEILSCNEQSVRLERLNNGAPVLNSHSTWDLSDQIGVVVRAWIDKNECKAVIRFSDRDEVKGIIQDVKNGIIRNISVGYNIYGVTETDPSDDTIPTYRITDWEPLEISLVCIPADANSGIRSKEKQNYYEVEIISQRKMENEEKPNQEEATRNQPNPAPPAQNTEAVRKKAADDERKRVTDIRKAVRAASINDVEFEDDLIERGVTVDQAREAIINKLGESQTDVRGQQSGNIRISEVGAEKKRTAMENALMHRANPRIVLTDDGRDFRGMTLLEMARECAEDAGIVTRGMSRRQLAEVALNASRSAGMHSTSDFPIILGNTVNRVLRDEYALQLPTFTEWASRGVAKDFRTMTKVGLGEVGDFKEVKEGGEYEYTTLGEGGESYKVVKYGQIIAITWETLINDDLDAFSRIPRKIVAAATRKQSDIVYAILTGSHKMSDGKNLFHADHNNLLTGAAIGIDSIGKMREAMRNQKGLDGKDVLNLTPKFLIAGSANEQLALQYTSSNFQANTPGGINVWSGLVKPIIEARIPGNAWFFAADPSAIDTVEYSFLEGENELFTEQRNGFEVDGLEIKARMVFGAKAIDWRGINKNPGQA